MLRHFIAAVLWLNIASPLLSADKTAELPLEWRVEFRLRITAFERHLAKQPSRTIEVKSTGEMRDQVEQLRDMPARTTRRMLTADEAVTALHLVWTGLEDAPLFTGRIEDSDYCHLLIETPGWTWTQFWFVHANKTKELEQARDALIRLIEGRALDPKLVRTEHRSAAEQRKRWMTEEKVSNLSVEWKGSARSQDMTIEFATRKLGQPMHVRDREHGPLIELLSDLRDRCEDRHLAGDKRVEFSLYAGGGTTITLRRLHEFSEAGTRTDELIRAVQQPRKRD